jgi:hypothetical protein
VIKCDIAFGPPADRQVALRGESMTNEHDLERRRDEAEFAVLARRCGVPLGDADIAMLYEGYRLLQGTVADLDRPIGAQAEPALIFVPESTRSC